MQQGVTLAATQMCCWVVTLLSSEKVRGLPGSLGRDLVRQPRVCVPREESGGALGAGAEIESRVGS